MLGTAPAGGSPFPDAATEAGDLDWQFLLPLPLGRVLLLGGEAGLSEVLLRRATSVVSRPLDGPSGLGRRDAGTLGSEASCPAALHDNAGPFDTIIAPGGVVCPSLADTIRRTLGSPGQVCLTGRLWGRAAARVRERLHAGGLDDIRLYRALPGHPHPYFLLLEACNNSHLRLLDHALALVGNKDLRGRPLYGAARVLLGWLAWVVARPAVARILLRAVPARVVIGCRRATPQCSIGSLTS